MSLNLPGDHNVRNALGAIAVAWHIGVDIPAAVSCLAQFKGIGRRFAEIGCFQIDQGSVDLVEDYGHHPAAITATIQAARGGWPDKRLVVVFQPHRYSRTRDLFDEFAHSLSAADTLVLCDIYAAGEAQIAGIDSGALCQAIRTAGRVNPVLIPEIQDVAAQLPALLQDEDLVLFLGAGSIGKLAVRLRKTGTFPPLESQGGAHHAA